MDKPLLERFIAKYNLGGAANAVIVTANGDGLHTKFISDDKNILGIVNASKAELEEGEYGIYNTDQLRSLLGVLEDKMKIKVVKTKGTPTGFLLSDKSTKVTYVLADKQNFSKVPDLKTLPPFEVEINVDEKFLQTFVRAKGALPDATMFTLITDGKKAQIVLGYTEKQNTNRVSMEVETSANAEIEPISFSAPYLKEALIANKEMKSGVLKISSKGIAHLSFDVEDFDVNYYLVKIERKD